MDISDNRFFLPALPKTDAVLSLESEVLLGEVAERHHDYGSQNLGHCGV